MGEHVRSDPGCFIVHAFMTRHVNVRVHVRVRGWCMVGGRAVEAGRKRGRLQLQGGPPRTGYRVPHRYMYSKRKCTGRG